MKDSNKKQILTTLIENIAHVADEEYQRRVWIEGRGPECEDFDEFTSYFFDESNAILEKYKDFNLTEIQHQVLEKFCRDLYNFFLYNYHPIEFVSDPAWKEIIETAKEVLREFRPATNEPH
jgi:hypothetical protein